MKNVSQVITDTRRGFRRTARRTPDKWRFALVALIFGITTLIPAIGLSVAAGGGAASLTAYLWGLAPDHPAIAVVFTLVIAFAFLLIMPLLKMAWAKLAGWDNEVRLTKSMED